MLWKNLTVKSRDILAIVLLGAWPFIFYWPVAIGQQVFISSDIFLFFLPTHTELARALAEGRLPLWTAGVQAGFPLLAEGQVAALYPLNLILHQLLLPAVAVSYMILMHKAWGSIGMYLLCRASGLRNPSALLAGLVFGDGGFMTAHLPHVSFLSVASWLPWLLLFQQRYWRARLEGGQTAAWFLLSCFSIALQFLGGFPPTAFFNVATFVLFGLLAPFIWGHGGCTPKETWMTPAARWLPRTGLPTLFSLILGVGLAAIQLLPTAELVALSIRAQETGIEFFTSFSLAPQYLTQLISPFAVLGAPHEMNIEFWSYVGVLPLFLALSAPILRRDFRIGFFLFLALLSLSLAVGKYNPLYDWLYNVPVFNRFRVPSRFLFLFSFAAAFLAATGFEALSNRLRDPSRMNWVTLVLGTILTALILVILSLAYTQPSDFWMDWWTRLPIGLVLLSVGLIIVARLRLATRAVFSVTVLGLTIFDLLAFSAPFLATLDERTSPAQAAAVPRAVPGMDNTLTPYRFFSRALPLAWLTKASIRNSLLMNQSLLYEKQSVTAYAESLGLLKNEEYTKEMSTAMQNLMNVRYYLTPLEPLPWGYSPSSESELPTDLKLPCSHLNRKDCTQLSIEFEPPMGLPLDLLRQQPSIPPTQVSNIEIVSYTDQSGELPDGFLAGEIVLSLDGGGFVTLPIRLGIDTGDWAYDGIASLGKLNYSKPASVLSFPAYLSSVGREFQGNKYLARYAVGTEGLPLIVTAVGVRSFLPNDGLTVESITLTDETGHSVSLASLLHRNNMTLVFRSHTAAMWENQDVLPRAFMVHQAEMLKDEQVLVRMKEPDFHPDRVVLLSEGQSLGEQGGTDQGKAKDQVAIAEYKSERVVVNVKTDQLGYLLLADTWYPGWVAMVDGQPAPIYRADYIFRAVPLSPGQHSVVFEYHPASFAWGTVISGLSLLVCAIVGCVGYFRPVML